MHATLTDALAERGYDTLTEVQEAVTDDALKDADLLVSAQTGSGKTVGFGLAIAHTLLGDADAFGPAAAPLALVVAPTRELAFQVMRELQWLYARTGARVVSCVGGMDMREERRALERGTHIVVGTPGRLRDHITRGALDLGTLRAVVLDEADEMLDLGFRDDLEFMLGSAPAERRTLLFSATVPPAIAKLAESYQRDAVRVNTASGRTQHADIAYQALRVAQADNETAIVNVLRYHDASNAIVFANTRASVSRLAARFANRGFSVVTLSGELSQTERSHALQSLRDGRARICVATDVAARGIDLPNLELVVHAELPSNAEGLLHRSGRTGRAGRKGTSVLIVPPKAVKRAERLLKTARITAEWTVPPGADDVLRADEARLLGDAAWEADLTSDERAFAATLLDRHAAEAIAVACLRLYRARYSAPEHLSPPDARVEREPRKPSEPMDWIALSVGRDDRAEPRWILPLLCRAGNLDRAQIGAIRVEPTETRVEIARTAIPAFLAALGPGGELERGVTARPLEASAAPSGPPAARAQDQSRPPRVEPSKAASIPTRRTPEADEAKAGETPKRPPERSHFAKPKARAEAPKKTPPSKRPRDEKPAGAARTKPAKPGPKAKPPTHRKNAADPSQRMDRPGRPKEKARHTPAKSGGNATPRRKPR